MFYSFQDSDSEHIEDEDNEEMDLDDDVLKQFILHLWPSVLIKPNLKWIPWCLDFRIRIMINNFSGNYYGVNN